QVDVVFPSSDTLEEALVALQAEYWKCECTLSGFLDFAKVYVDQVSLRSKIVATGFAGFTDEDAWCLDTRGILTLAVRKQTYETLGLVGEPLPWKERADTHVIRISLRSARPPGSEGYNTLAYGVTEAVAIRSWDSRRGPWNISFYLDNTNDATMPGGTRHEVLTTVTRRLNVHVPDIQRGIFIHNPGKGGDTTDDWEESASALFEWVGMASLGSPRLSVNDQCDPYIAVYHPPEPSRVGDLISIRYTGFVPSIFVEQIFETLSSPNVVCPSFVALTGQCILSSPVTYLPTDPTKAPPLRAPRADSEDTWSLVYSQDDAGSRWIMAESTGQWDKRWG
ncbi:ribonuclease P 40kDa subunit-domain-containing protein, partial [Trametes polyzona]